jgi:hypothetical protein
LVKPSAVMGAGLASAVAALFTSRFGVAGTVIGAALTTMIITAGSALFGLYVERAAARARGGIPGVVRVRPPRRRSILLGALLAAAASFVVGMGAVTGVELGVGKSVSCWVWDECPAKDAGGGGGGGAASGDAAQTRPSILVGGRKALAPVARPGGVGQPRQTSPPREQAVPDATSTPRGRPGGVVGPEPRSEARDGVPPQEPPGGRQPAQERSGVTPPDGQAPNEQPSAAPGGPEQPVPSDDRPADRPPSGEQPGRPSPWVHEQRPT